MDVITCINNVNNTKTFRLHSKYNNNVLEIIILQDGKSYICKVTRKISNKFAQTFEIDYIQYEEKLVNYLSKNCLDVRVDIINGEFIVFKNKIKYFHCVPEVIDYSTTVCLLLDNLSNKNVSLDEKLVQLENEKESIIEEKDIYKSKLEEYVKENSIREEKLYSCFVQLLNEKKQRIQFLTEMLDAGHGNKTEKTESSPKRKKVGLKNKVNESISDSESNVDSDVESYKTDDEAQPVNDEAKPSTSKNLSLLDDDDDDDEPVLPRRVDRGKGSSGVKSSINISQTMRSQVKEKEDDQVVENTPNVQYSTQDMIDSI